MTMRKLTYSPAETSKRTGHHRVQAKMIDGVAKVRKWNYKTRRWGKWALL